MAVQIPSLTCIGRSRWRYLPRYAYASVLSLWVGALSIFAPRAFAQEQQSEWQVQVRKYCDANDWPAALRVVDQRIAQAPNDLDLKAWHARVLGWSGNLAEAQQEYLQILSASPNDPDVWAGLGSVYAREGKDDDALLALGRAVQLDPKRADLRIAHTRALREAEKRNVAAAELKHAASLELSSTKAPVVMKARSRVVTGELRVGNETDFLNYSSANQASGTNLATRWTPFLRTNVGFAAYLRGGVLAEKFTGSATANVHWLGSLTAGGAIAHDRAVIPKNEAFFDLDRGWKTGEATIFRGLELDYGQHWYWYQAARILTLSGTAVLYFPRDWSFSLAATGARSAFSGTGAEWRPSGSMRVAFPLATGKTSQLSGNIVFAAGTENFASADQIGGFASQTYGGGLRFRFAERQDISCGFSLQRRTQNRTDTYLGLSYGIHF